MKIQHIKLQGFIGLKEGLGVDSIDLDLSGLTGLTAIEGDNGKGKTTFLENLQPFRTLPSRKSKLKSHCFLKNSFKELEFIIGGNHYRTLVKMDATTTVKDEGYIWKNHEPQVNGLVSEFDRYIIKLMGSQNLFFHSIFCAQNSDKLSNLRPAELKALYAEFLQLDRYIKWEKTGKDCVATYTNALFSIGEKIGGLERRAMTLADPRQDLKNGQKVLTRLDIELAEAVKQFGTAITLETIYKAKVILNAKNREKLSALEKEKTKLRADADALATNYEVRKAAFETKKESLEDDKAIADKDLEDAPAIEEAVKTVKRAEKDLSELRIAADVADMLLADDLDLWNNEKNRLVIAQGKLDAINNDMTIKDKEAEETLLQNSSEAYKLIIEKYYDDPGLARFRDYCDTLRKSAKVLDDIDPGCTSEICGLITQSLDDKKKLPGALARYEELKTTFLKTNTTARAVVLADIAKVAAEIAELKRIRKVDIDAAQTIINEISACIATLDKAIKLKKDEAEINKAQIKQSDQIITTQAPLKDRAPLILIAKARAADLESQIKETAEAIEKATGEYLKSGKDLTDALLVKDNEIKKLKDEIDPNAEDELKKAELHLDSSRDAKTTTQGEIIKIKLAIEKAEKDILTLVSYEDEIRDNKKLVDLFAGEAGQWSYLAEACSKDGLRALEIEGVAPVITGYANDMLTTTFGPSHTVRFETQDENGKEVLDIVIIREDGSETLLSNGSGGEQVWILKALRLAQTLISQEKSGRHFLSALMDEEDGALSNKNAIKFIQLYRTLMKMAKMEDCYYISHRPEAIAMADNRIVFEKGGISVI